MDKRLSRLLKLASRTGDRLVVLPEGEGEPFVILPLHEYERVVTPRVRDFNLPSTDQASDAKSGQQRAEEPAEASMLADNYEFEPLAYEETGENVETEPK